MIPNTTPGKWSLGLIIAMPILFFFGSSCTETFYKSVPSGRTLLEDIAQRPVLALTMLSGMIAGILAFLTGILAIRKHKERAVFVYLSTVIGMVLILFLFGEVLFPH